jgi:hypothetical protein
MAFGSRILAFGSRFIGSGSRILAFGSRFIGSGSRKKAFGSGNPIVTHLTKKQKQ